VTESVVRPKPDERSALSIGLDWGTRITSIGLEFALPAFLGFGADRWLETAPAFTILGAFLGLIVGMLHTIRLASSLSGSGGQSKSSKRLVAPDPPEDRPEAS